MTQRAWLVGAGYMLVIALMGILVTTTLLAFTALSERNLSYIIYTIHLIALWSGGYISGRRSQEKGWYYGGIAGLFYALLLTIIGFLAFNLSLSSQHLFLLLGAFLISAFGGIIGVNRA